MGLPGADREVYNSAGFFGAVAHEPALLSETWGYVGWCTAAPKSCKA